MNIWKLFPAEIFSTYVPSVMPGVMLTKSRTDSAQPSRDRMG